MAGRFGGSGKEVRSVLISVAGSTGSVLEVVRLDAKGRGRVLAGRPGGRAAVTRVGWVVNRGLARTSYVAKAQTVVLGAGRRRVSAGPGLITLDRTVSRPKVEATCGRV